MRLLNAETICLEEYFEESVPKYAILSHTWGPGEVSFQDLNQDPNHKSKAGYHKIAESCRLAVQYGYGYVWVDTCCIDKSSSAELSEAINSMCRWYENSGVCFVYLADVPSDDDVFDDNSAFSQSRWHSRGWTLQELLAPKQHVFFGSNWGRIARYRALMKETTDIDLISDLYYLDSPSPWKKCSVATKLSWASRRRTTRKEDIAYCLLGLLEVQIPLLYGEGDNAFRRLLIKLMEQDNSHDIFLAGY
ncbi:heterokaryon incompatibility protein-domain-containing protein, partial [Microdochium bolleyi]